MVSVRAMTRIPYVRREELGPEGQQLWDSIVGSRGEVVVTADGGLAGQREGRIGNLRLGTCRQHAARVAAVHVPDERRVDVVAEKFLQPFR